MTAPSAEAETGVKPSGGAFVIKGAGFGHGHGMSQYGAYGAAKEGLSWQQILAFYYPGTTLQTLSAKTTIKVWITADDDNDLRVQPAAGLQFHDSNDHSLTVPTGSTYHAWRITRSGAGYRLAWEGADGAWTTMSTPLDTSTWHVSTKAKVVRVRIPNGATREYRGTVSLVKRGSGGRTVNKVELEDYVRSVVPSEMPTSWAGDAVRAQAVAARSFAIRMRDFTSHSGYDICDTTACQVYGGKATTTSGGTRIARETKAGDVAVRATAGTHRDLRRPGGPDAVRLLRRRRDVERRLPVPAGRRRPVRRRRPVAGVEQEDHRQGGAARLPVRRHGEAAQDHQARRLRPVGRAGRRHHDRREQEDRHGERVGVPGQVRDAVVPLHGHLLTIMIVPMIESS